MNSNYIFETEHLGFRRWNEDDKIPFAKMNANKNVMKFFPEILSKEQSDELVDKINNNFNEYGFGLWAVEKKETQQFIGFIGFSMATFKSFFTPCIEIGWRLDNKHWNKGYATEGAKVCLEYGFNNLGIDRIYSFTAQLNIPSINVMKKLGLRKVGTFEHPRVKNDDPLKLHVLYKLDKTSYN